MNRPVLFHLRGPCGPRHKSCGLLRLAGQHHRPERPARQARHARPRPRRGAHGLSSLSRPDGGSAPAPLSGGATGPAAAGLSRLGPARLTGHVLDQALHPSRFGRKRAWNAGASDPRRVVRIFVTASPEARAHGELQLLEAPSSGRPRPQPPAIDFDDHGRRGLVYPGLQLAAAGSGRPVRRSGLGIAALGADLVKSVAATWPRHRQGRSAYGKGGIVNDSIRAAAVTICSTTWPGSSRGRRARSAGGRGKSPAGSRDSEEKMAVDRAGHPAFDMDGTVLIGEWAESVAGRAMRAGIRPRQSSVDAIEHSVRLRPSRTTAVGRCFFQADARTR